MALITIAEDDLVEYHGSPLPAEARLYANEQYRTNDGVLVLAGNPEHNPEAYQTFAVSMVGTTVRIAAGNAHSSTDSDRPHVGHRLSLYDAEGGFLFDVFTQLRIPPEDTETTWETIQIYSTGRVMSSPPTYLDSNAILALIVAAGGDIDGGDALGGFEETIDGGEA